MVASQAATPCRTVSSGEKVPHSHFSRATGNAALRMNYKYCSELALGNCGGQELTPDLLLDQAMTLPHEEGLLWMMMQGHSFFLHSLRTEFGQLMPL